MRLKWVKIEDIKKVNIKKEGVRTAGKVIRIINTNYNK